MRAEARAIAARLVQDRRATPPATPDQQFTASRHELSPADEERLDAALADLMGLPSEITIRAAREAEADVVRAQARLERAIGIEPTTFSLGS